MRSQMDHIEARINFIKQQLDSLEHYLPETYQFLMEEMDSQQRNLIELKVKDFYKNLLLEHQNQNPVLPNQTISDSSSKDPYEVNK
ncbi:hypothetical protein C7K55_04265 [Cyanobium usitatum str. Tous]|uniref:Uncharacterized protein n=1 Tax=Cyanobium usitatum str. Tous TaxID=2116684 RepID=A0A2P7MZN9_9CYAN|nr:hypothetical protein C7K55_04265 [Cyanobium usitatum str. Tous]